MLAALGMPPEELDELELDEELLLELELEELELELLLEDELDELELLLDEELLELEVPGGGSITVQVGWLKLPSCVPCTPKLALWPLPRLPFQLQQLVNCQV